MSSQGRESSLTSLFKAALFTRDLANANPRDALVRFVQICLSQCQSSKAQLLQDLFVLFMLHGKRNGYFIEFGATNGIDLSNSFLLESQYGWSGILAEPARCWHEALRQNRRAAIDMRCVWTETGKTLSFNETAMPELSTISEFSETDDHRELRRTGKSYDVETISLNDLLQLHDAPQAIDYLSIDTEGSELDILQHFDFERYDISIMTVEHNFVTPSREAIHRFLATKNYVRVFSQVSQWDDWYVKRNVLAQSGGMAPLR